MQPRPLAARHDDGLLTIPLPPARERLGSGPGCNRSREVILVLHSVLQLLQTLSFSGKSVPDGSDVIDFAGSRRSN